MATYQIHLERKKYKIVDKLVEIDAEPEDITNDVLVDLMEDLSKATNEKEWKESDWEEGFSTVDKVEKLNDPCPFCTGTLVIAENNHVSCFDNCGFTMYAEHYQKAMSNKKK